MRGLLAVLLLVIASSAGAAGLGRLAVLSAIGEPLRAEIEVSVSAEELETATARFAPAEAYAPAGLQYNSALNGARLAIQYRHNGRRVIDIVTTRPVNEPAFHLMVELEVRGGRIIRVYNVLLAQQGDGQVREAASAVMIPVAVPPAATPQAKAAPAAAAAAPKVPPASRPTLARPPVAPVAKSVAAADNAAFDRELKRLESQMIASARVLAGMLDRVEVMERQVAQLQQAFAAQGAAAAPKPVAEQPAADKAKTGIPATETPPLRSPAPVSAVAATAPAAAVPEKTAAAPAASPPPLLQEGTGQTTTKIDTGSRSSRKSDYLLNVALLVLAGGALVLFVGLGYMVWGRRSPKATAAEPQSAE